MSGLRQIEFYGNRGIGKSATSQNTFAALVDLGQQILFVGCPPKTDSSRPILNSKAQDTVLHLAGRVSSVKDLELETRSKSAAKVSNAWSPVVLSQPSAAPLARPPRPVAWRDVRGRGPRADPVLLLRAARLEALLRNPNDG